MSDIQAAAQAQIREGAQALADKLVRAGLDGVLVDAVGLVLQYREEELRAALRAQKILTGADEVEKKEQEVTLRQCHKECKELGDALRATKDELRRRVEALAAEAKRVEEARDIEGRDAALQIENLRVELRRCKESWNAMRDESEDWKSQLDEARQELGKYQDRANIDRNTIDTLQREQARVQLGWDNSTRDLIKCKEDLHTCEAKLLARPSIIVAGTTAASENSTITELRELVDRLRVDLREAREGRNAARDESEGWKVQLEDAQRKLAEAKSRAAIDASTLSYRKQELADARQSWNQMRDEAVGYKKELEACREELRGTREALQGADAHFQEVEDAAQGISGDLTAPAYRVPPRYARRDALRERRVAWRHYAGFAMTLARGQFSFNQITEIADKALEAEEKRFGAFK